MENKNKSKAFIITFIIILLLLIGGYYLFKNTKIFGTKGSSSVNKIFSPLFGVSKNKKVDVIGEDPLSKNLNKNVVVMAEAGEDLLRGDVLYVGRYNENNDPVVYKAIASIKEKSVVFGVAGQDIKMGEMGEVIKEGVLDKLNTNKKESTNWAVNDLLYLSDITYGGMLKDHPVSPSFKVTVAMVLIVDPINGIIQIGGFPNSLDPFTGEMLENGFPYDFDGFLGSDFGNFKGFNPPGFPTFKPISGPSSTCTNNATNPPKCTTINGKCINGATNPDSCTNIIDSGKTQCNDGLDNDGDKLIDAKDPNCHIDGDLSLQYIPTHNSEKTSPASEYENTCTMMDSFPLEFTSDEQAELDELLRKFFLIAPELRSSIDVEITYSEIEKYINFREHLETLTSQCYSEGVSKDGFVNPKYKGPTTRYGNPWYQYNTNRGSYFKKESFDCKYVSGWFSGRGLDGTDCDTYNKMLYTPTTPASCTGQMNFAPTITFYNYGTVNTPQREIYVKAKANKCVWNTGVKISELEKIVNVW